jgi:hypothetical protein
MRTLTGPQFIVSSEVLESYQSPVIAWRLIRSKILTSDRVSSLVKFWVRIIASKNAAHKKLKIVVFLSAFLTLKTNIYTCILYNNYVLDCVWQEEDNFGFRPGLTHDEAGSSSGGSTECSSPTLHHADQEEPGRRRAASLGSHNSTTAAASAAARHRKFSIGSLAYGHATHGKGAEGHKPHVRRKSDGHVHWADEFQKDLARLHPRKTYSRHPSHCSANVRPILKSKPSEEFGDDCLDEADDETQDDDNHP